MTGRNANVFYEVGYADAKKKLIILLTQKSEDIPFDLKHRPHVIYDGSIKTLKNELSSRVLWALEELENRNKNPIVITLKIKHSELEREDNTDTAVLDYSLELRNITDSKIISKTPSSLYNQINRKIIII